MGYVAVKGGKQAIEASLDLIELKRARAAQSIDVTSILENMSELVNQVMSEGSLWDPELAALALKQAQGSVEEAVFLVRAYRSTLERKYTSRIISTRDMEITRRISAAFKDIPGGQMLGASRDYSHRLIDFDLADESLQKDYEELLQAYKEKYLNNLDESDQAKTGKLPKVSDYLREEGILPRYEMDDSEPEDVTQKLITFPASRSICLQVLTRGLTQAVIAFGYAIIRGFGMAHPTVGELRRGSVAICVDGLETSQSEDESYYLGSIEITEVESLIEENRQIGAKQIHALELGYGLVYGADESKAISMSVLDYSLSQNDVRFPTQDQEFVLYHIDSVEATGFISHLKLPHYVTFSSKLDSSRQSIKNARGDEQDA